MITGFLFMNRFSMDRLQSGSFFMIPTGGEILPESANSERMTK